MMISLGLVVTAGCIGGSSDGPAADKETDNSSAENEEDDQSDNQTRRERADGISIQGFRRDSVPEDVNCISPDDDQLRGTVLLEVLQEGLKRNPPSEWGAVYSDDPTDEFARVSKYTDKFDKVLKQLNSLPKATTDGFPCIKFEEYTISITWSYEYDE